MNDGSPLGSAFDRHERARWSGRAAAYSRSFAQLCAHPADTLLDAAAVTPATRLLDVGTGPGHRGGQGAGPGRERGRRGRRPRHTRRRPSPSCAA